MTSPKDVADWTRAAVDKIWSDPEMKRARDAAYALWGEEAWLDVTREGDRWVARWSRRPIVRVADE